MAMTPAPDSFPFGLHDNQQPQLGPRNPTMQVVTETAQQKPAFAPGDIVYLKSGSPTMTVNSIRGGSQVGRKFVSVEWFNEAELKRDMFDPECLTSEKPAA